MSAAPPPKYDSVFGRVKAARLQSTKKKDFVRNVATKDTFLALIASGMLSDHGLYGSTVVVARQAINHRHLAIAI